ncbi:MAG: rhomboid family intramembrane serine protease [Solirubrobacteraceae bacterium]
MIPIKDNIPSGHFPLVTVALIGLTFIAYLLSIRHGGLLISGPDQHTVLRYGAIPFELTHPGRHCDLIRTLGHAVVACQGQAGAAGRPSPRPPTLLTVFTSMFMHGSIVHLVASLLFLWIFGNNVEASMGSVKFLAFYIAGGLAALVLQVVLAPGSTAPTIGAAGAVAAVLGGYIVLHPHARVLTLVLIVLFFTVIEVPAVVMLGLWFALQALFVAAGLTNPTGGGAVSYLADVGSFVFGLIAIRLLATRRRQIPSQHAVG